jgi:hypothetical protein
MNDLGGDLRRMIHANTNTAILNYQWSQSGGPKTQGERIIVWAMLLAGLPASVRYFKAKEYGALGCMFIAPASAVVGTLMSG